MMLVRIFATRPDELDCDTVQPKLPAYAEAYGSESGDAEEWAAVGRHLSQCPGCRETLDGLVTLLAELDAPPDASLSAAITAAPEDATIALT